MWHPVTCIHDGTRQNQELSIDRAIYAIHSSRIYIDFQDKDTEMKYSHSNQKAAEYLRLTLKELGEYNLPATPSNYAVWYEFFARVNPSLNEALEGYLGKTNKISQEMSYQLYLEHIINYDEVLTKKLNADFQEIVKEVLNDVSSAGGDVSHFGRYLTDFSKRFENDGLEADFKAHFKELLAEVKKINNTSITLQQRLKLANEEVASLQTQLKKTEWFASTDALTGLWNRHSFEDKLMQSVDASNKNQVDLSLVMLDIDHFKNVNDTFGHLAGDDLLRVIAKTIKDFVRGKDFVCRYGGEEFIIILTDTALSGAVQVAEKIRTHFSAMIWKQKSSGVSMGKITLSCGVSQYRQNESTESFVQRADVALYQSKRMGRNQVTPEMG
jgi:diguanylate cyclase